ncbi:CdaR family protein [Pontibacillus litoralis]|uniref:YbbR-like domain-containing protein ybbR n=1 Tax=Pontibacillus litoralis JSM 072002 TaxID=1385512 RepID=A0A0A5FU19_9BACI|nr:CdaR family protein [Pontibacillus litoralis]KGX84281.1 hypothetical protein N784_14460 [Pontibacillus litoralis JSM 072002]
MDKWLKNKWFIRVFTLVIALLLYASVNLNDTSSQKDSILPGGNKELMSMNSIPLQVYMNDEDYVVEGVPETITVTVEGPSTVVTRTIIQKNFEMFVDLNDLGPGTYTVPVEHKGISNQLSVYTQPKELEVTIEEKAQADYAVQLDYVHASNVAKGYEIGEATVKPSSVTITGSKAEVEKVSLVKAIVDVQGATDDVSINDAPVKVYDQQGNELNVFVEPNTVQVDATIIPPHKEVPVQVKTKGELPEGLSVDSIKTDPEKVKVYGAQEVLDAVDAVETTVDLSNMEKDTTLSVDLTKPDKASKIEPGEVKVEIDVEKSEKKTLSDVEVGVKSQQEGQKVTFIEPANNVIEIKATGTDATLKGMSKDDFEVFVNVEEYSNGEHTVPIEIEGPKAVRWNTDTEQATIQIE